MELPIRELPRPAEPAEPLLAHTLDGVVRRVVEATHLLDAVRKVTGRPEELSGAAEQWLRQAVAMAAVAKALRAGAAGLAPQWEGAAAEAFGAHMGRVVEAVDAAAAASARTAAVLATAAVECRQAERTVLAIVREAIEWMLAELAIWAVLDLVTVGLATLAQALVSTAQIAAVLARVDRVCVQLGLILRQLDLAVRELRQAEKAAGALRKAAEARRAAGRIRQAGSAFQRPAALRSPDWWAAHLLTGGVRELVAAPLVEQTTGLAADPLGRLRRVVGGDPAELPDLPDLPARPAPADTPFG